MQYTADGALCNLTPELLGWQSMPERDALLAGECQPLRPADGAAAAGDAGTPTVQTRVTQTLWPEHCLQGTGEAELHPDLAFDPEQHVLVQKGTSPSLDGYSALCESRGQGQSGQAHELQLRCRLLLPCCCSQAAAMHLVPSTRACPKKTAALRCSCTAPQTTTATFWRQRCPGCCATPTSQTSMVREVAVGGRHE